MILERLAVLAAVIVAIPILICFWRRRCRRRLARLAELTAPSSVRNLISGNAPAILYFTTRDCAQCRYQQSPILERFSQEAHVSVYPVDAVARQELVRHYGIMTVPSTVVLDAKLRPVAINHGLTSPDRLQQQIETIRG